MSVEANPQAQANRASPQGGATFDIATSPIRRPIPWGSVISALALLLVLAFLARAFAQGQIHWAITGENLFNPLIVRGAFNTLWLSVVAMVVGIVLGTVIAVMRSSSNPVMRTFAFGYQWVFRGLPLILQLLIWFNLALIFPRLGIPGVYTVNTVEVITPYMAAILGLGLNQAAYSGEIIRAGLLSVDRGQYEAALAVGMTEGKGLRRIIFPQAMRVVIPPMGNEFIGVVKMTSLASIIGFQDLLRTVQNVYYVNARIMELLFVAAAWYLVIVTVLSFFQSILERRYGRGFHRRTR